MQAGKNIKKNIVGGETREAAKVFRKKAEISSKLLYFGFRLRKAVSRSLGVK